MFLYGYSINLIITDMANKFNSANVTEFFSPKSAVVLLRIVAPFLLIYNHGYGKVMAVVTGNFWPGFDPIGIGNEASLILAAFAEGICALLVILGLYTRGACIVLMINFAVAILFHHIGMEFKTFELVLLYFFIFLTIFFTGPGKFSIDDAMHGNTAAGRNY